MRVLAPKKMGLILALWTCALYTISVYGGPATSGQSATVDSVQQRRFCDLGNRSELVENRYLFAGGFSWITKNGAELLVNKAKAAGFNIIVPAVWKGRGAGWPTKKVRAEMKWIKSGIMVSHDPLEYLIKVAHQESIEVHPWFTLSKRQADFLPEYHDPGTPENFFNVHDNDFRNFIIELVDDVVSKYDIDGLNLDYVRAGGICRSRLCREDYRERTGRSLDIDASVRNLSREASDQISHWNRLAVNKIVEAVAINAKRKKPGLFVSVDTHLDVDELLVQGVDAKRWLDDGIIDSIFHMQYLTVTESDLKRIDSIRSSFESPENVILLVGNFAYSAMRKKDRKILVLSGNKTASFIDQAKKFSMNGNGVALFEYSMLTDEQVDAIKNGPFRISSITTKQCLQRK